MSASPEVTSLIEEEPARPATRSVLLWTAWFGMISGAAELGGFLLKCHYLDPRNANVSRHFPWMYPVAGVLVLAGPGLLLALATTVAPSRVSSSAVLGVLSFIAYLGVLFRWPIYTAVCLLLAAALAYRTAPFLAARIGWFDRMVRRSLVVLTALLAATLAACYGREAWSELEASATLPTARADAKNVILIVLDTVRAESLSLYGYHRETTPNLSRLSGMGVRFDRAFATAPWTAPSHASMFTGRWPHELSVGWNRPLDRTSPTLAEFLSTRGYDTAGFVANTTYCSYETGLDRGFAHYEDYDVSLQAILLCSALVERTLNFVQKHPEVMRGIAEPEPAETSGYRKSATRINDDFLAWLSRDRQRHHNRPFFAFLNYFDAHHPYLVPESDPAAPFGRKPESLADIMMLKNWWELDKRRLGERDVELARDSYDRCITYLDREIGRLFVELRRRGVLRDSLVIITADHGEHFGEQRLFGHGCSLYLPELHVPLLVIAPGARFERRVVTDPVSLRDLAATIVDKLGFPYESPFPGRSLAHTWSSEDRPSQPRTEPLLSEIDAPPEADPNHGTSPVCRGPMTSLVSREFHYIRNGDGREELYDFERDPHESRDLSRAPEAAQALGRFRGSLRSLR